MMKILNRKIALGITGIMLGSIGAHAQIRDFGSFMAGGVSDAQSLMEAYISPYANAFGASLNGGWYNTARVHKPGGFDLTFSANLSFVPTGDKTYDLSELGLSQDASFDPANSIAQTVAGSRDEGPALSYSREYGGNDYTVASFNTPAGTGLGFVGAPTLQLGLGLVKETEIIGRYMPTLTFGKDKSSSLGLWGIGIKHSIKQWIPALKRIPVFHLSAMGGYTQMNFGTDMNIVPEMIGAIDQTTGAVSFEEQSFELAMKSFNANILVSANLPVVCFYGGVGLSSTKTTLDLTGYYPVPTVDPGTLEGVVTDESAVQDPFDLEITNKNGTTTSPRLNAGIRFKFAVITLHFDYTYASYSVASAGLGISFR